MKKKKHCVQSIRIGMHYIIWLSHYVSIIYCPRSLRIRRKISVNGNPARLRNNRREKKNWQKWFCDIALVSVRILYLHKISKRQKTREVWLRRSINELKHYNNIVWCASTRVLNTLDRYRRHCHVKNKQKKNKIKNNSN